LIRHIKDTVLLDEYIIAAGNSYNWFWFGGTGYGFEMVVVVD